MEERYSYQDIKKEFNLFSMCCLKMVVNSDICNMKRLWEEKHNWSIIDSNNKMTHAQ